MMAKENLEPTNQFLYLGSLRTSLFGRNYCTACALNSKPNSRQRFRQRSVSLFFASEALGTALEKELNIEGLGLGVFLPFRSEETKF